MTLPPTQPCPYCEHPVRPGRRCWGCMRDDPIGDENLRADADHQRDGVSRVSGESPRTASVPDLPAHREFGWDWTATLTWGLLASDNLRHTKAGGKLHDPRYIAARDGAALYLEDQYDGEPIQGPVRVRVDFYPPDKRVRDCCNFLKALHDALAAADIIEDDRQIREWEGVVHEPVKGGRADIALVRIADEGRAA